MKAQGKIIAKNPSLSPLERMYINVFGVPISGLRIRLRRVLPQLPNNAEMVLDAGCGRGVFTFEIAQRLPKAQVVGVDLESEQLAVNQIIGDQADLTNISFLCADVTKLPFKEKFDLLVCIDNLEHLENDLLGIESLFSTLAPGGKAIIHVPGYERRWLFFNFKTNFDVPGHFRPGYTKDDINNKLKKAGFLIEKSYYTYGWFETVANNFSYLITKAEAKNKALYALIFPLLNGFAWLGRHSKPKKGAGVLVVASKPHSLEAIK